MHYCRKKSCSKLLLKVCNTVHKVVYLPTSDNLPLSTFIDRKLGFQIFYCLTWKIRDDWFCAVYRFCLERNRGLRKNWLKNSLRYFSLLFGATLGLSLISNNSFDSFTWYLLLSEIGTRIAWLLMTFLSAVPQSWPMALSSKATLNDIIKLFMELCLIILSSTPDCRLATKLFTITQSLLVKN